MDKPDTKEDRTLFNNFWLNEIKSIDDSIRVLMNITVILTGAYITILAANFNKISNVLLQYEGIVLQHNGKILMLFIIFFVPLNIWFLSFNLLIRTRIHHPKKTKILLNVDLYDDYLMNLAKYRRDVFDYSYILIFSPFLYIFLLMLLTYFESVKVLSVFGTIAIILTNLLGTMYSHILYKTSLKLLEDS